MPRPFCSAPSGASDASSPSADMNSGRRHPTGTTGTGTGTGTGDAAASGPAGFLQQLHLRMRTRCCAGNSVANAGETRCAASSSSSSGRCPNNSEASRADLSTREVSASVNSVGLALPCLLQSWRRRIDCMAADSDEQHKPDDSNGRTRLHHHESHQDRHRHLHHHHRTARCHRQRRGDRSVERAGDASLSPPESTTSSSSSTGSSSNGNDAESSPPPPSPPPLCMFGGFELPKLLHPRLERQRACASLSGLWGASNSPLPSPDAGDATGASRSWRPRCHPYWRSSGDCSSTK